MRLFQDIDEEEENQELTYFYKEQADVMKANRRNTMYVNLSHIFQYDTQYEMVELILNDYYR